MPPLVRFPGRPDLDRLLIPRDRGRDQGQGAGEAGAVLTPAAGSSNVDRQQQSTAANRPTDSPTNPPINQPHRPWSTPGRRAPPKPATTCTCGAPPAAWTRSSPRRAAKRATGSSESVFFGGLLQRSCLLGTAFTQPKTNTQTHTQPPRQFGLLVRRSWRQVTRDKATAIARLMSNLSSAIVFGAIYFRMGRSQSSIQDRLGLLQVGGWSVGVGWWV
jgi:hypothetical protein